MAEKNYADRVKAVFFDCMFHTAEEANEHMTAGTAILSKGIVVKVGFHPERLEKRREDILQLMNEIVPDVFYMSSGGGMSFSQLPFDRDEEQWGEQKNAEQLYQLAHALGHAGYCVEDPLLISILPGGLPYVWFSKEKREKKVPYGS